MQVLQPALVVFTEGVGRGPARVQYIQYGHCSLPFEACILMGAGENFGNSIVSVVWGNEGQV